MEDYLVEHASRYKSLVAAFKPTSRVLKGENTTENPEAIVASRLRPFLHHEVASGVPQGVFQRPDTAGTLDVHELKRPIRGPPALPTIRSSDYQADRSFDQDASSEQIFDDLVKPLVPWAWAGGVGTLFAYGQTGSGKTFTVTELQELIARALLAGELQGERRVHLAVFELAGNSSYDLLNSRRAFSILEDSFGITQLAGALEKHVTTVDEILGLIDGASRFRRTESTEKNDSSSRSHAICRIRIENHSTPEAEDGLLYLVDLAGSEAARDKAKHGADRMKETREINTSLSVLKDCIRGRAEADALVATGSKKKPYIPFRQSALTKVLKHVFDPKSMRSCKTVVIACINPSLLDIGPSKNTLRYAEMLRVPVPEKKGLGYDPAIPMTWTNAQMREWIEGNSGDPHITSSILAPTESGAQLLRILEPEFESRCLSTIGVSPEQAKAFRSKFWQMHVDSQRNTSRAEGSSIATASVIQNFEAFGQSSSRDPSPNSANVPFIERIRAGMVVSWDAPAKYQYGSAHALNMAVILCPATAFGANVAHTVARVENSEKDEPTESEPYLCALVSPGIMQDSYVVDLWRQAVVKRSQMKAEVVLEYDSATRSYHIAIQTPFSLLAVKQIEK